MQKRIITVIYILFILVSSISAQARFSASTENYTFGQIEWKNPVTAHYVITNTGDQPLVLSAIEPDCACTEVKWTKTPIAAGGQGTIDVTFDAKALGYFKKSIAVYTNAKPGLFRLWLSGQVLEKVADFTRTHPYQIGDIRIDCNKIEFPDVHRREQPSIRIGVANLSPNAYEPILMHLPAYLEAKAEPQVLQQGEKGIITLTLNTEKLTDFGLVQTSVYLSRFMGDKVGEENAMPVSVTLLPDFSTLTKEELDKAPVVRLTTTTLDVSGQLKKKNKTRQDITITNEGYTPLEISKLQVLHPALSVSIKKSIVKPGESVKMRVTVIKKNITEEHNDLQLLLITNDPKHPKVLIDVKH